MIARGDGIGRVEIELELARRCLVVPALDRHAEALETMQHDIEEPQLLA